MLAFMDKGRNILVASQSCGIPTEMEVMFSMSMEENWVSLEERGLVVSSEPMMGNGLLVLVAIWVREISFLQSLMQFSEGFYKLVI